MDNPNYNLTGRTEIILIHIDIIAVVFDWFDRTFIQSTLQSAINELNYLIQCDSRFISNIIFMWEVLLPFFKVEKMNCSTIKRYWLFE